MANKDLTVRDVINTMTQEQKNTLYYYVGIALKEKIKIKFPCASIESFDDNQKKVFYYLIGCALDENLKNDTLEIIKGDNNAVERAIYMMSARGNGKTQYISELLKNRTVVYNGNIYDNIKDVIFNDPATIVFWTDGSKTVVKCQPGETFDPEKGLAMAISKKVLGNDYSYYETFAKHVGRYNKKRGKKDYGSDRQTT